MTMTDEEWEKVEKSLSRPYGHAKFMIDGYTVDIAVQPEKKKLKKVSKAIRESITQMAAYTAYSPFWGSFSRMKAHFIRNNQSIRLIKC